MHASSRDIAPQCPPGQWVICWIRRLLSFRRHPRGGCTAHIRRKFIDVHRAQSSATADEAIKRIAQL
ncbi:IS66 family transposase [Shimia thalassica]|uniref:IS66 family transposase n=1 Tax=Shimia thalassica TaxID=1715693 RepID=UPI003D66359A